VCGVQPVVVGKCRLMVTCDIEHVSLDCFDSVVTSQRGDLETTAIAKAYVARPEGLEPPTSWSVARRSIQLSYGRMNCQVLQPVLGQCAPTNRAVHTHVKTNALHPKRAITEQPASVLALALIVIPWVLGGLYPTREDLTWSILLSFGAGFLSIIATVMSAFDIARTKS
jgi:hypothetical protein